MQLHEREAALIIDLPIDGLPLGKRLFTKMHDLAIALVRVGHADTGFLERTYCHPQMQLKQEAAKRMSNSLFATPNPELLVS